MNIGATTLTQPATIGGSGGVAIIDPSNNGLEVLQRTFVAGDRAGEVGWDFLLSFLSPGDVINTFHHAVGVGDSATNNVIIGFDYDTTVFAAGGAIKWQDVNGVHKLAIYAGVGVPNGAGGANGDFAFRQDGAAGTSIYMKRAGAWVGII